MPLSLIDNSINLGLTYLGSGIVNEALQNLRKHTGYQKMGETSCLSRDKSHNE